MVQQMIILIEREFILCVRSFVHCIHMLWKAEVFSMGKPAAFFLLYSMGFSKSMIGISPCSVAILRRLHDMLTYASPV